MSESEVRRHRRRERAAAAVGIPGVDAGRVQLGEHAAVASMPILVAWRVMSPATASI
jgi:hypothetical protein